MDFLKSKFEEQISARVEEDFDNVKIRPVFGDANFDVEFPPARIVKDLEPWTYDLAFDGWKARYIKEQLDRADDILSRHADSGNRFNRLKNAIGSASGVIPFVGAGMSCESGFKGWQGYLWSLQASSDVTHEELEDLLTNGRFEDAAELLLTDLGENLFEEKLQTAYTAFDNSSVVGAINYLPQLFKKAIVTTNFDTLIEKVYELNGEAFDEVLKGKLGTSFNRHISEGRRCLLKFHGHFSEPTTRVLTKSEYDSVYGEANGLIDTLKSTFKGNTLLFLGCSLDTDRTMQAFKSFVDEDREAVPSHFAFLPEPGDEAVTRAKERMLSERKIFPIWYPSDEHDISIDALFIKALSELKRL